MFKKTQICAGVLVAMAGVLAAPAYAQAVDRVEITGSLIKRVASETALPVTVIRADELAVSGVTNAEQVVALLAQNQSSTVSSSSVGSSNGGASYANLRGVGASRTLVLLNGKRMVNNPYSAAAVDLNVIPLVAIDRVEVLTDGASAIYGTDAVAGVINFITKRDFQGFKGDVIVTKPQREGGGDTKAFTLGGGIGSLDRNGFNIFGGINWRKFEALKSTDRGFARTAYLPERGYNRLSPTTYPANYTQGAISTNPTLPNCLPPFSLNVNGADCRFDFIPFINIVPDQEQKSAMVKAAVVFAGQTASLEVVRAENDLTSIISPTPITALSMTPGFANPYFPGGSGGVPAAAGLNPALPISLNWRTSEVGGRQSNPKNTTDRVVLQLEGALGPVEYQLYGLDGKSTVQGNFTGGYLNKAALQQGLNCTTAATVGGAGTAVPCLNPFGAQTAAGLAYMQGIRILGEVQKSKGTLQQLGFQASAEMFKLPGGAASIALAGDHKKEKAEYLNNFTLIRQAASSGLENTEDISGDRTSSGLAVEAAFPILKGLEITAAVRFDKYSDFGNSTNPKLAIRYQPVEQLLLRASANTGFRAPTLYDLFQPNSYTNTASSYNDPVLCPGGVLNVAAGGVRTRDCSIQFQRQTGGNRALEAEKSKAFTLGFVAQPSANFSFGMDYWSYFIEQSIGSVSEAAIFADTAKYANLFVRCSAVPNDLRLRLAPCQIAGGDALAYVQNGTLNTGNVRTSGIDLQADFSANLSGMGKAKVAYRGTVVAKYEFQREKGGAYFNNNGIYFDGSPVSRYGHTLRFALESGPWEGALAQTFRRGYTDCNAQCNIGAAFTNKVADYELFDLNVTYKGIKGLTISGGILNLLNVDPPYTNKTQGFQAGFDERYTNPLGRVFTLKVGYQF